VVGSGAQLLGANAVVDFEQEVVRDFLGGEDVSEIVDELL